MLLLAIDTSGRHGSVALCRGNAHSFETLQLTRLEGGTYSARLMPTIAAMLQQNNLAMADLDAFAVVSGPGSFTGLRVGLATIKGLCEVLQKPLATVSMLEALAIVNGSAGNDVTAILDAGRSEIYVGEYRILPTAAARVREFIVKLGDFDAAASSGELLTPDGPIENCLREKGADVRLVAPLQADEIGRIGIRKLLAGEVADHATVDVNYIRRSDAEIFSAPKR